MNFKVQCGSYMSDPVHLLKLIGLGRMSRGIIVLFTVFFVAGFVFCAFLMRLSRSVRSFFGLPQAN